MTKRAMTDDELLAITGNEIRTSTGYRTGRLSEARRKNLQYYLGRAVGDLSPPEIEGRSSVVDSSVHDTVEWMLPSLIKTFTGGDSVVEFAPQQEEDEDAAKQMTDYANYIFYRQNPGFQLLNTWFKDALLSKTGIMKVMWQNDTSEVREEYNGLSEEDLAQMTEDSDIEIIENTSRPDEDAAKEREQAIKQFAPRMQQMQQAAQQEAMTGQQGPATQAFQQATQAYKQFMAQPPVMLHDIAVKRTKNDRRVRIYNVPPEEFLINRDAKSIEDSRFCAHQVLRTISDLTASGYKDAESLTSDDIQAGMSQERIERITYNDETGWQSGANEVPGDPSQKQIWVTECYMKVDADGDGIAEWRKITRAGNKLLDNEPCDGPPFVSITPIPLPHQFFGLCPADQALEIQKQKTAVMRAILDNLYLTTNGRYFAVDGQVNLDDLLTSRPGGVVRIKSQGAVGRLDQGAPDATGSYQLLDYLELQKESRTGLMRNTQGTNPDAMNQTATGINITTNRADSRIELIARQFAETGMKDLFKLILKLVGQNQDKAAQIRVAGKWVKIDPRAWRNQYDMTINVGLGTGNKDQEINHLMALIQSQQMAVPAGIVTPENMFHAHSKLSQALGYKQEGLFFSDPADPQTAQKMPPKPPDPEQAKAQAAMQIEQAKGQMQAQSKQVETQATMQLERDKMEMQARVDQNRQQVEAQQQQAKRESEAQLAQFMAHLDEQKAARQLEHDQMIKQLEIESAERIKQAEIDAAREKCQYESEVKLQIAQMSAQTSIDTANMSAQAGAAKESAQHEAKEAKGDDSKALFKAIAKLSEQVNAVHQHATSPRKIVRGPDGKAIGVDVGGVVKSINRGPDGRMEGI